MTAFSDWFDKQDLGCGLPLSVVWDGALNEAKKVAEGRCRAIWGHRAHDNLTCTMPGCEIAEGIEKLKENK